MTGLVLAKAVGGLYPILARDCWQCCAWHGIADGALPGAIGLFSTRDRRQCCAQRYGAGLSLGLWAVLYPA